jgi:hypothetical protein
VIEVTRLLESVTERWVADPEGDVVWTGYHEGRRGVRMRQTVRDMTTVWFEVGERTLRVEAYVLPSPPQRRDEVFRTALTHNARTRRLAFALDRLGDLILVARIPVAEVTEEELELTLGEIYDLVEVSFRAFLAAGFGRETKP